MMISWLHLLKLPPDRSMDRSGSTIDLPAVEPDIPSNSTESNLADAFSAPISGAIELSALEKVGKRT